MNQIKSLLKILLLKCKLIRVNYTNLNSLIHIGKYSLLKTDADSVIHFNKNVTIHDYIKILADYKGTIIFGEKVHIGDYSTIRASEATIEIGSNTMLAQYVMLVATNHAYKDKNILIHQQGIDENKKGIKIGSDCWLAAGCIILPGVTIGNGVVVGAHAVVTKDLPDYAVAVGNPATIISYRS